MAAPTKPADVPTAAQLAALTPAQRDALLQGASDPAQRAALQAQMDRARQKANHDFITKSRRYFAVCTPAGGGTSAAYVLNKQIPFEVPTAEGGHLLGFVIAQDVTYTLNAGSSAVYGLTPAAPFNFLDEILLDINGEVHRFHPYLAKLLARSRGFSRPDPSDVLSGVHQTYIDNLLDTGTPVAAGANETKRYYFVPLNALHSQSVQGLQPIFANGSKVFLKLKTNSNGLIGTDPLMNPFYAVSGTGHAASSIGGSLAVYAVYVDGTSLASRDTLPLYLDGEGTTRMIMDQPLTNLTAGSYRDQPIHSLLQHYKVFAVVIDGQQSSKFCDESNILGIKMTRDSTGTKVMWGFGDNGNVPMDVWWMEQRRVYGQDMDKGVITWVDATQNGIHDPSNSEGSQTLNMMGGSYNGFTDVHLQYKLSAVGSVCNPRVELFLVSFDPEGMVPLS